MQLINLNKSVIEYIYTRLTMMLEFSEDKHPEGSHFVMDYSSHAILFEGRNYTLAQTIKEIKNTFRDYLLKYYHM